MPARKKIPKPTTTKRAASILIEAGDAERMAAAALKAAQRRQRALNHPRLGERALAPRADVNRPCGEETGNHVGL
jgi:hypothetical protein